MLSRKLQKTPQMATPRNIIGLDYGSRRIGVAIANTEARMADPLLTLDLLDYPDIFTELKELFSKYSIDEVVVGLPRDMEGNETNQTAVARKFAADLEKATNLKVNLQDEAATSIAAEEELKASRKPYQKEDIDKTAAAIILNDWLSQLAKGVA